MNSCFELRNQSPSQRLKNSQIQGSMSNLMAILKLLASTSTDVAAIDLNCRLEIDNFQLGDELFRFDLSSLSQQSSSDLYLICKGQARVLCNRAVQRHETTALLLELGETFGADYFFCKTLLPYRVIAANPCQIARIPFLNSIVYSINFHNCKSRFFNKCDSGNTLSSLNR